MFAHAGLLLAGLTLTSARPPQQALTNNDNLHHNNHHNHQPPSIPGFVALGDSYSAGIGTPIPGPKENNCRQGTGAYPFLLAADLNLLPNPNSTSPTTNTTTPFQWLSCTGSLTTDLLSTSNPNSPSQIDTIALSPVPPAFATLSIGGNDLGFFDVLNACIFRFYSFYSGTCASALAASEAALLAPDFDLRLLLVLRETLDKVQWEKHPRFTITVTGYAKFFNAETEECDGVSLGVWWGGAGVVRGPKLTKEVRGRMNGLVERVNAKIRRTVEGVNGGFAGMERVVFVDYDKEFEGHRFCEEGVKEPDYGREETWFFLPGGGDSGEGGRPPDGNGTEVALGERDGWLEEGSELVDVEKCLERAERGGDWGERALCYMAVVKSRWPNERLVGEDLTQRLPWEEVGTTSWRAPTYYGKTFHPRSKGHEAIRDNVYEVWRQHGIKLGPRQ
ncbi:SGNH hydrolase-type esterase domain-containing protein [Cercophora newfieldiana]|uniref:SGNH hydrolase-type esterase domain-containing protein n=1 Tax=Cercophora newfieldiana TaxID=92897 RepID=A0AA39Y6V8_9PEZI|nr:SGNH hydrolase-type esterase domain-containing protein [Cercophora newfieldiana]